MSMKIQILIQCDGKNFHQCKNKFVVETGISFSPKGNIRASTPDLERWLVLADGRVACPECR